MVRIIQLHMPLDWMHKYGHMMDDGQVDVGGSGWEMETALLIEILLWMTFGHFSKISTCHTHKFM